MKKTLSLTTEQVELLLSRPRDMGWRGRKDMFSTWALGPVLRSRDEKGLLDKEVVALTKHGFVRDEDFEVSGMNHWALSWVDHLSFKVFDEKPDLQPGLVYDVSPVASFLLKKWRKSHSEWLRGMKYIMCLSERAPTVPDGVKLSTVLVRR